jgi:subtilisin family serine protease
LFRAADDADDAWPDTGRVFGADDDVRSRKGLRAMASMKLSCGKNDRLHLDHVPLHSRIVRGARIFEPKRTDAARAAFLTNRVVARHFGKAVGATSSRVERAAIGADKVQVATFCDDTGKLRIVYREAIVRFEPATPQAKRRAVLAKFKLEVRARNPFIGDQVTVFDPRRSYVAERMIELANALTETEEIAFAFPNFVSEFKRMGASRPHAEQWQLDIVEARKAWKHARGEGVTIAILDDGVDVEHPNLRIRRRPDRHEPRDLYGRDFFVDENSRDGAEEQFDPRPKIFRFPFDHYEFNDIHGTACAGVAAATGNVAGVYGVAPRARILPVKIFHGEGLGTESRIANAIRYASRFADILSCSWEAPRGPDMESALKEAGRGRGGKGCPLFFASGNENGRIGYPARSPHAIAVGASTYKDKKAHYSNHGPRLSLVAPSGVVIIRPWLDPRPGMILTTDLSYPRRGFNVGSAAAGGPDGLHYNKFSGTSSSTPFAAGIAALVLSANPRLTSAQVRSVLQETADKIGPKNGYKANGHSNDFGYGRVNAARAVAQARRLAASKSAPRRSRGKVRRTGPRGA